MNGWLILGVYIVGFVVTYRVSFRFLTSSWNGELPGVVPQPRAGHAIIAGIWAYGWPLVAVAMAVYLTLTPDVEKAQRP